MGGHGGLNILPQKRWNVYNFDNREKVKRDEEAAAKEEQLKREQSRKRDAELRLETLRQARSLSKPSTSAASTHGGAEVKAEDESSKRKSSEEEELKIQAESRHINLFEGIRIFDPISEIKDEKTEKPKKLKKEEVPRVVTAEDEKYRLGYGVAGKGVKLPWYMARRPSDDADEKKDSDDDDYSGKFELGKSGGNNEPKKKKSLVELREERLKREKREKEREKALLMGKSRRDGGFSLRR